MKNCCSIAIEMLVFNTDSQKYFLKLAKISEMLFVPILFLNIRTVLFFPDITEIFHFGK